jgi:hypothetical protein
MARNIKRFFKNNGSRYEGIRTLCIPSRKLDQALLHIRVLSGTHIKYNFAWERSQGGIK